MSGKQNRLLGIPKNVFVMGLVSFFNDIASEMIYPIVPIFLTSVLGVPVSVVGLIEGIAESTASILKVFSGWMSDKLKRRKPFIIVGYSLSAISKAVLASATIWPIVLLGRFIDRFGKGTGTSPRDALIAESAQPEQRGKAFGFHRALDTAGAVVGPLAAIILLQTFHNNYTLIFSLAIVPSVIGVLLLLLYVREQHKTQEKKFTALKWSVIPLPFKNFLLVSAIFAIGNSSDAFLILRSQDLGLSVTATVLAYVLFNFVYAIFSTPIGAISDKIGAKKILILGFFLFALIYISFGLIHQSFFLWLLFPLYGVYMALTEGISKAYISNLASSEKLGSLLGLYQTIIGLCAFLASLIAGVLWSNVAISAPFLFGGITSIIAAILLIIFKDR